MEKQSKLNLLPDEWVCQERISFPWSLFRSSAAALSSPARQQTPAGYAAEREKGIDERPFFFLLLVILLAAQSQIRSQCHIWTREREHAEYNSIILTVSSHLLAPPPIQFQVSGDGSLCFGRSGKKQTNTHKQHQKKP